jgi:hypothetical protein
MAVYGSLWESMKIHGDFGVKASRTLRKCVKMCQRNKGLTIPNFSANEVLKTCVVYDTKMRKKVKTDFGKRIFANKRWSAILGFSRLQHQQIPCLI